MNSPRRNLPDAAADTHDHLDPSLRGWLLVQDAVRRAVDASAPDISVEIVDHTLDQLRHPKSIRPNGDVHRAAQRCILMDLRRLLTCPHDQSAGEASASVSDVQLRLATARQGDVLSLVRLDGVADTRQAPAAMSELRSRVRAAVRSDDHTVVVDDQHLLVVLNNVPLPVAWRRMNGLVGERPQPGQVTPHVVRAGLALVGTTGSESALEAARTALTQISDSAAIWIALAPKS